MPLNSSLTDKSATVIAVVNEKGGSPKTATAVNTAAGLARLGFQVLLIDLDSRAPLAGDLSVTVPQNHPPIAEAIKTRDLESLILETPIPSLFLAPGDLSLDEKGIVHERMRETLLRRAIEALNIPYDFILLDPPTGLNLVTLNTIMAADFLIIPCNADRQSLEGAKRTIEVSLEYLEYRPEIKANDFYRILISILDKREKVIDRWTESQIRKLRLPTFQTSIHRCTSVPKSRALGLTVFDYAARQRDLKRKPGRAAADFLSFTKELLCLLKKPLRPRLPPLKSPSDSRPKKKPAASLKRRHQPKVRARR